MLDARSARLVLVVAPAGYGKSTLLAEWAHCDPRRFIPIVPGGGDDVEVVVEGALQDAADLPSVFVIDDAHSVPAPALRQLATAVLAELDSGSQLVIASRTEPSLPIGRLRAQRELVEIRTEDLAMSPAEAANLLRLAGLELDFASVQALSRETEDGPRGSTWRRCRFAIKTTYAVRSSASPATITSWRSTSATRCWLRSRESERGS